MSVERPRPSQILLTIPDAAACLSISPRALWRFIAEGRLTVVRLGRSTRIRAAELERFIAEQSRDSATEASAGRQL